MIVEGDNKQEKGEALPAANGVDDTKDKKDDDKSVSVENKEGNLGGDSEILTEAQRKLAEVTRLRDDAEERNRVLSKEKEDAIERIGILSEEKEELEERNRVLSKEKDNFEEKIKILSKEKEDAIKSLEIEVFKLKEELQKKS